MYIGVANDMNGIGVRYVVYGIIARIKFFFGIYGMAARTVRVSSGRVFMACSSRVRGVLFSVGGVIRWRAVCFRVSMVVTLMASLREARVC